MGIAGLIMLGAIPGCRQAAPYPQRPGRPASLEAVPARPLEQLIPACNQWKVDESEFAVTVEQRNRAVQAYRRTGREHWGQMGHKVRAGETLYQIAQRYYGDGNRWRKIYENNREQMSSAQDLRVGMLVYLPGDQAAKDAAKGQRPDYYVVGKGDTLYKIARRFLGDGSQWGKILEANKEKLSGPDALSPGIILSIPGKGY